MLVITSIVLWLVSAAINLWVLILLLKLRKITYPPSAALEPTSVPPTPSGGGMFFRRPHYEPVIISDDYVAEKESQAKNTRQPLSSFDS